MKKRLMVSFLSLSLVACAPTQQGAGSSALYFAQGQEWQLQPLNADNSPQGKPYRLFVGDVRPAPANATWKPGAKVYSYTYTGSPSTFSYFVERKLEDFAFASFYPDVYKEFNLTCYVADPSKQTGDFYLGMFIRSDDPKAEELVNAYFNAHVLPKDAQPCKLKLMR